MPSVASFKERPPALAEKAGCSSESGSGSDAAESLAALAAEVLDPAKERKLLLKLDSVFVPIVMMVYLSCFLDRSNIGNVKVAGMPADIGASPAEFSTAVSIFYATYVAFEAPWAILLKKLTPRFLLTALCVVWSMATVFSGFITSVGGLYAARLVLGACEGGLFPGLNLYLTMVYKRDEQGKRVSYLFVCTALSGAFGGLLAYVILKMDRVGGYAGWRWVYIIEGILSVLAAAVVWFCLPDDPSDAYFLGDKEKHMMRVRAAQRARYMGSGEFSWEEVRITLEDPKMWISGAIQFCQDVLLYGFSTFLPSIITSMGYGSLEAQYLTIPVYMVGGLSFMAFAYVSDRLCVRGPFILLANAFGIAGYVLILCPTANGVRYFGTFLCAAAVYNGPGLNLTWLNVNVAPHYRRAAAIGFQQTLGNTAGIVAGQIYRQAPYVLGNGFSVGAIGLAQFLVVAKWAYVRRRNDEKRRIQTGEIADERSIKTGDRELDFKYHL
ncbi:major facilitator superfamily domain-containing protein [Lasiosphaeria miniovina]|uniref:Major facilitator superfamily domain-containing protein n=1 Tax=Lasiosphaeria miniovina TaxID=1954250 RepID=A0AA39ZYZ1_9PEZI|nr:major facilitator superfamily domain-containing protein [Lasiosphaeria miniovina]KAK0706193.1 major facilitator superfamily domain-containing protein [Lasiosphaeria miniovina]